MLLVRVERRVGELLITQKLHWCWEGLCQSLSPHCQGTALTVGHADRAVDDFAGIVMDRDGDLVGGH